MGEDKEKAKFEIDGETAKDVQDRLNRAEYTLQLLDDGAHTRMDRLLGNIASHYRIVNDAKVLDEIHQGNKTARKEMKELLLKNSKPAGTVFSSFANGEIDIMVSTLDINQAELISRSNGEVASIILQAIGLNKPAYTDFPMDDFIEFLQKKRTGS